MPTDFIGRFAILAGGRIRFVVVGGLALLLHGLDRLTAHVDLVIDLAAERVRDAVSALTVAGYRPLAPVNPLALADPVQRHGWQTTRNMQVFSFWDSTNTRPTIDVMLASTIPFEELWSRAVVISVGGYEVRVACGRDSRADCMRRFDPDAEPSAWGSFEGAAAAGATRRLSRSVVQCHP